MKLYNLICGTLLTLTLVCFLVIPQQIFAEENNDYQILSEFETKRMLEDLPSKLYDKFQNLMADGYSDSREKGAICLLKEISNLDLWSYYLQDLPVDVSFAVAKQAMEISKLIASEDVSGILGKIEKETAKMAVNSLKKYFFQNQIKVSFGAMEVKYKTSAGDVDSPFQYIIMYKPIDDSRGRVVTRIYSAKEIIPPDSRGSIGLSKGFLNSLDPGQKIPPFIVEISGEMEKGMYGSYKWKSIPEIKTIFPDNVPDFGLKPKTWQEKYVIEPIKKQVDDILSWGKFFGFQTEVVDYVFKEGDAEKIDKEIKSMKNNENVAEKYPEEVKKEIEKETVERPVKEVNEVEKQEKSPKQEKEEIFIPAPCSKNDPSSARHSIIFNEIAWMGSKNSANDEWIELKNVSGKDIDLKGYAILNKKEKINIIFSSYILRTGDFVLLERTDDTSVPYKQADVIYQGALSNSDEELYLFDSSCNIEDYVSANPDWPAGDNTERRTMERMNDFSWSTYGGGVNNSLFGTPREVNSYGKAVEKKKEESKSNSILTSSSVESISGGGFVSGPNYCPQSDLSSPTRQVIISEIAWMGSEASSSDEWIELKNISGEAVDLSNWQLLDNPEANNQGSIRFVFSQGIIEPGGFYLLERTDDDSVPNIEKNAVYSGSLSDTNESLRIFDSNCVLIDEVSANPDWPAGNKEERRSMERSEDLSWNSYYPSSADPVSGLMGTPKSSNSAEAGADPVNPREETNDPTQEDPDEESQISVFLLITEVQFDESGGHEYVELFNYSDEDIDLCPSEDDCYYLSYYSSSSRWSDPHRNWKFPEGETILSDSYYIIDIFGDSEADWRIEKSTVAEGESPYYSDGQMAPAGSLALFYGNPRYGGEEEKIDEEKDASAVLMKIDAVAWGSSDPVAAVREGSVFTETKPGKVLGRKWSASGYQDADDNAVDFQAESASPRSHAPKPPSQIKNLSVSESPGQKNSAILSWDIPDDDDTPKEEMGYEIYYSRNSEIEEDSLLKMDDYVSFVVAPIEDGRMTALIPDLYYSSDYSFAVKAKDPQGNYSPLSDSASLLISPAVHQKPAIFYDFSRSDRANFAGPVGSVSEPDIFIQGDDTNPNNDNFALPSIVDENGTVYFFGQIDGKWGIYAYSSAGERKWLYECGQYGNTPSLGKDGAVYFSDGQSVFSLSPSGKVAWQVGFAKVYTKDLIIDSAGRIYFIASENQNDISLISFDGETKTSIYDFESFTEGNHMELAMDGNDNIFFSEGNRVFKFKFGSGKLAEMFFPAEYADVYPGLKDKAPGTAEQVHVASDGTVLVNIYQGWWYNESLVFDLFCAVDNDLKKVNWSNRDFGGFSGLANGEIYMSLLMRGGSGGFWKIVAVDLVDGRIKWEKSWRFEGYFDPPTAVVPDSGTNIYFTRSTNIIGYDSLNIKDNNPDNDRVLSFAGPEKYLYSPLSIAQGVVYVPMLYKIGVVKY